MPRATSSKTWQSWLDTWQAIAAPSVPPIGGGLLGDEPSGEVDVRPPVRASKANDGAAGDSSNGSASRTPRRLEHVLASAGEPEVTEPDAALRPSSTRHSHLGDAFREVASWRTAVGCSTSASSSGSTAHYARPRQNCCTDRELGGGFRPRSSDHRRQWHGRSLGGAPLRQLWGQIRFLLEPRGRLLCQLRYG